jgi:hypothetical protein
MMTGAAATIREGGTAIRHCFRTVLSRGIEEWPCRKLRKAKRNARGGAPSRAVS